MGSNGESQDKGIDATVGGLVWVRRRNGSWWPGQIIDTAECAESLMASPRSGTPIKLLGREDVSVDWYNLEKSKRVKPFRCGEYDVCIEKAKCVAANSARKAVKYARRDDAILQALEIEMEKQSCDPVKSSHTVSLSIEGTEHTDEKFSGLEGNNSSVANQVLGSSVKQSVQARPRRTPNDSEDDGAEGVKRMRGLDDLGMGPIPAMKRKRTLVGHVHEFLKKKNRSRPLTKVLESSTKVPFVRIRAVRNGLGPNESNRSSSVVINNSDSIGVSCENRNRGKASGHLFETVLVSCKPKEKEISDISAILEKASSEKLVDLPLLPKRTRPAAGTIPTGTTPIVSCQKLWGGAGGQSSQSSQVETVSLGNEESVSTSSGAADVDSFSLGIANRSSRWQSKGKRNSRNIRSKKRDLRKMSSVNDDFNDNLDEYWGRCGRTSSKVSLPWGLTADTKLFTDSSPSAPRSLPYRQSRSVMNPKYGPEFSMINHDDSDTELFDVHLEVKASSRRQHVPYISLMSKLTGRPVVGHPLTAEVLEEGSADNLVRDAKWDMSNSNFEMNFFVSEDERKSKVGGARVPPKHLKSHRVSPVKSTKLRKSSPSKKIRKLSSLTGFTKLREGERNIVVEKIVAPALACVPLKVAYSRINAALRGVMRPPRRVVVKPRRQ